MTTLRVIYERWRHGRVIALAVTLSALSVPAVAQQPQQPAVAVEAKTGALEALLTRGSRRAPKTSSPPIRPWCRPAPAPCSCRP